MGVVVVAALSACGSQTVPVAQAPQQAQVAALQAAPTEQPRTLAQFAAVDNRFTGQARAGAPVVYAGDVVPINGSQFKPGQMVTLIYEGQPLAAPVAVDAQGKFSVPVQIPAQAQPGRHPVVVSATGPNAAMVVALKVSPKLAASGQERFALQSAKVAEGGLYQSAYSAKSGAVFVTRAAGRPPVAQSELVKLDAQSLQVLARITPAQAPERKDREGKMQPGGVFAVYGVGVDDARGTVWVSNTRQNTVAVYRQSDLRLLKQLPPQSVGHPRDVVIDGRLGKAFVSTVSPKIEVFDTRTMQKAGTIEIQSTLRGAAARGFASMSLALDAASGKLFAVSSTGEVAVIDAKSQRVERVFAIEGVTGSSGVAYDARSGRLFVASQGSDDVAIVDAATGRLLHRALVGASPLNVAFDPASGLAYVVNRAGSTIAALNAEGQVVGNWASGPQPNHISVGGQGVYVVNSGPASHPDSGQITRIQAR